MTGKTNFFKPSFLITAGPTREYLDPVRFLSNPSTGKMGVALANEALRFSSQVTLCLGPVDQNVKENVTIKRFCSCLDLHKIVSREIKKNDILIMAAAVSDYCPVECFHKKIKKGLLNMFLHLKKNPDILKTISSTSYKHPKFFVGFAAETENIKQNALNKLENKQLHMIVANQVYKEKQGFSSNRNKLKIFVHGSSQPIFSCTGTKKNVAKKILPIIIKEYRKFLPLS